MKIQISLDYVTVPGESLVFKAGGKDYKMEYLYAGVWFFEGDLTVKSNDEYSFEVWMDGQCVKKEWMKHRFSFCASPETLIIRDRWLDRPQNSPFHSSLFRDVVFRRPQGKIRTEPAKGNVTFKFISAEIRSNQTVAITGSGRLFGDWKKVIVMDDSSFPVWRVSLNVREPFEYKFLIVDRKTHEPVMWEKGGNHFFAELPPKGWEVIVGDVDPNFPTLPWRGAGVAIPVFSLRSEDGFGIGEFLDIKKLVDWAVATGQNVVQLLPINDTTMTGTWQDSYPYNANTTFALHPQFVNLPAAGVKADKAYKALRDELNALPKVDYERVNGEKDRLMRKAFASFKPGESPAFLEFVEKNSEWLLPYSAFRCLTQEFGTPDFHKWGKMAKYSPKKVSEYIAEHKDEVDYHCFVQYHLDAQLKEAVAYAHAHGVALKGDLPIGISRTSVDAWQYPELYHLDSQAGAPPDVFAVKGQNWGFPTYNWERMAKDGFAWWKSRMKKMSEYFDAFRIDHILGFFRIWEIPMDAVHGLLGHFNPAMPYSEEELKEYGFDVEGGRYVTPLVEPWVIDSIFGDKASEVSSKYIKDGHLAPSYDTQRKVLEKLPGEDKQELREGLMDLIDDVLFVEDPRNKGYYHPRISAQYTYTYQALEQWQKDSFNALYNDFFYHRHNDFWKDSAMAKLPSLLDSTSMLTCGEDLGMIPACVPDVMKDLRILSLEVQRMPKDPEKLFGDPSEYPYLCVCATGSHDTSNIRAWWEEDRDLSERFYHECLHASGEAPYFCEPWVCDMIVGQHVKSPAMLCILPLQDWLSVDASVRYQGDPSDERINVPAIPRYYWRYRMHLTLENLLSQTRLNEHLKGMIRDGGRNI